MKHRDATPNRSTALLAWLVSLVLHTLFVVAAWKWLRPFPSTRTYQPVKVRLVQRSSRQTRHQPPSPQPKNMSKLPLGQRLLKPRQPKGRAEPKAPTKGLGQREPSASPNEIEPSGPEHSYRHWLPRLGDLPFVQGGGSRGGEGKDADFRGSFRSRKLASHLSAQLDIPLVLRRSMAAGKAVAALRLLASGRWMFAYVDGEPHLRAVLYESLRDTANRSAIQEMFSALHTREVIIGLNFATEMARGANESFEESLAIRGNHISIKRLRFAPAQPPATGGGLSFTIPDKAAESAKRADSLHLDALLTSPAFIAPIRERLP